MNPSYIKRPNDKNAVRNQYMNLLALESANIQKNWNANQIFKETGQTKPNTLPDTRTTTDKRADLERLKLEVRSELSTITDAVIANDISQKLAEERDLLVFASDQIEFIKRELEIRYKNGFPAAVAISFITKLQKKYQMTEGVDMGLQQDIGGNGSEGMSYNMQDWQFMPTQEIYALYAVTIESIRTPTARKLAKELTNLKNNTPETRLYERAANLNPQYQGEVQERLKALLGDRMTSVELEEKVSKIKSYAAAGDLRTADSAMKELNETITEDSSRKNKIKEIQKIISRAEGEEGAVGGEWQDADETGQALEQAAAAPSPQGEEEEEEEEEEEPVEAEPIAGSPIPATAIPYVSTLEEFKKLTTAQAHIFLDANGIAPRPKHFTMIATRKGGKAALSERTLQQVIAVIHQQHQPESGKALQQVPNEEGMGLKKKRIVMGKGLAPKQATPTPKPFRSRANRLEHLIDKPMEKPKPYTPLGKYVIHKHKLQDGILQIKTAKGGTVGHFPTEAISSELSRVLRKIVGGSMVDFDEINELKDGDKSYLNKIVKTAHLSDKISVPKPDYGREKIELNRFQILKGEIGAGNDNKEMVKEFKILLMKFVNQGRVPRRQAMEILTELACQGM